MTELSALAGSEGYAACDDEAQRRSPSAAGNPRSAECTSWERRSSEMTELSALAGSEGYAACDVEASAFCYLSRALILNITSSELMMMSTASSPGWREESMLMSKCSALIQCEPV